MWLSWSSACLHRKAVENGDPVVSYMHVVSLSCNRQPDMRLFISSKPVITKVVITGRA